MNNRYLYRAKREDNGEWVEGYILQILDDSYIFFETKQENHVGISAQTTTAVMVDPSTICQCTGLKDKYGKLIFEHDIVKECSSGLIGELKFGEHEKGYGWYIEWIPERARFYRIDLLYWQKNVRLEVVSNILDNQDLGSVK